MGTACSASNCIWSDKSYIPGQGAISTIFPNLEDFFVDKIGVSKPDLQSYIRELKAIYDEGLDVPLDEIKKLLLTISTFAPEEENVSTLLDYKMLPVENKRGQKVSMAPRDTFAILDLQQHREIFKGKIAILDLSMREIRDMTKLLSALSLDDRYSSRIAVEISEAEDEEKDSLMTEDLRSRAVFLYRSD